MYYFDVSSFLGSNRSTMLGQSGTKRALTEVRASQTVNTVAENISGDGRGRTKTGDRAQDSANSGRANHRRWDGCSCGLGDYRGQEPSSAGSRTRRSGTGPLARQTR